MRQRGGSDVLGGSRRGVALGLGRIAQHIGTGRCRAIGDVDAAWLHDFGNLAHQVDVEQAVVHRGADDAHVLGQLEAVGEVTGDDAAMWLRGR